RKPLWDVGLDYRHGTGHGVGMFLNVHEGPVGISLKYRSDDPGLQSGMILSNEPGFYEDRQFGIRIESLVLVTKADTKYNFGNKDYLKFETITLVPLQTKLLDPSLLTEEEIEWLDSYHQTCREVVGKALKEQGRTNGYHWLIKETQPLGLYIECAEREECKELWNGSCKVDNDCCTKNCEKRSPTWTYGFCGPSKELLKRYKNTCKPLWFSYCKHDKECCSKICTFHEKNWSYGFCDENSMETESIETETESIETETESIETETESIETENESIETETESIDELIDPRKQLRSARNIKQKEECGVTNVKAKSPRVNGANADFRMEGTVTLTGWGVRALSGNIMSVNLKILPSEECAEKVQSFSHNTMACAKFPIDRAFCKIGESGGPLIQYKDERAFLVGILLLSTYGLNCQGAIAVFEKISTHSDWIEKNAVD
ncbi:Xaa-Pro aminopeptidase 1-like protein, partial [Dinothrombium tinctorium]